MREKLTAMLTLLTTVNNANVMVDNPKYEIKLQNEMTPSTR